MRYGIRAQLKASTANVAIPGAVNQLNQFSDSVPPSGLPGPLTTGGEHATGCSVWLINRIGTSGGKAPLSTHGEAAERSCSIACLDRINRG